MDKELISIIGLIKSNERLISIDYIKKLNISKGDEQQKYFPEKFQFEITFPKLTKFADEYDLHFLNYASLQKYNLSSSEALITELRQKDLDKIFFQVINNKYPEFEAEIVNVLGQPWKVLHSKFEGYTTYHIILCLVLLRYDLKFVLKDFISDFDKQVLQWTFLLHDISKHVKLEVECSHHCEYDNKLAGDKIHPFKSVATLIDILAESSYFNLGKDFEELAGSLSSIFRSSIKLELFERKHIITFVQDITSTNKVKDCLDNIDKLGDYKWVTDLIVLVGYHQSLPNCEKHMNQPLLSKSDYDMLFTPRLLELMRVMMINDSTSHSRFIHPLLELEINSNIDKLQLSLYSSLQDYQ